MSAPPLPPTPTRRRSHPAARAALAAGLALSAALAGLVLTGSLASAQAPAAVRIDAPDAIAAGVAISAATFDDAGEGGGTTALHAVIGRDDAFADSLAAGPLLAGGPLLYVPGGQGGTLPEAVAAELQRILPPASTVYIAGGEVAVAPEVQAAIEELGFLTIRLGGEERTETAAAVAAEVDRLYGAIDTILVANAGSWPDAVAGGSLAASGSGGGPGAGTGGGTAIVLTEADALAPAAAEVIEANPDAEVVVLGGTVVIADAVAEAAGVDRRLAGDTRAATAAAIAGDHDADVTGATVIAGFTDDGWVLGNAAASRLQPLLLNGPSADEVNDPTRQALAGRVELTVLGGTDRISDAGVAALEAAR